MMKKLFRFMPVAIVLMVGSAFAEITPTQPSAGDGTENNPFQITSAAELYWLAATVNNGECKNYASGGNCSAALANDITLNSNLLGEGNKNVEENGNFDWNGYEKAHNWNDPESWSPIGTGENPYQGTFNGNNKTVSGVFNSDVSNVVGFFGRVGENGVVKNVGVVDSYFNCNMYCGGIVGENDGSVSGVSYAGVVNGGEDVGGIIGKNNGGASVRNVYKTGTVYGSNLVGGIVGDNGASINNAFNMGTVSGSDNVGGVAGQNSGSVSKAYYNTDVTCENCAVVEGTTGKTAAELATINLAEAFPLQGSEMENPWANDISYDKATGKLTSTLPYLKNFPVVPDAETILSFTVASGVIQISSAEDLKDFARLVNEFGITDANAELTADICLNACENGDEPLLTQIAALPEGSEISTLNFEQWTPIGANDHFYAGTFNGNGYAVSGLYFDNSSRDGVGLFGVVQNGTVKNVGVVDSYINGKQWVGGVVGEILGGTIRNVYNAGFVSGSSNVGGVVGYVNFGTKVGNAYNKGPVSGDESVGGVVGYFLGGEVINVYSTGSVSGTKNNIGYVVGRFDGNDVTNGYYKTDAVCLRCNNQSGSGKTTLELYALDVTTAFSKFDDESETPWVNGLSYDKATGKLMYDYPYFKNQSSAFTAISSYQFKVTDEVIQIGSAEDLKMFAKLVSEFGFADVDAKLVENITLNDNLLGENNANVDADRNFDVEAYGSAPESWTPIGTGDYPYTGTFDGAGKIVSGLYLNDHVRHDVGLFGIVKGGTIQNVGVEDSYFYGDYDIGGVVGNLDSGKVVGCHNKGVVRAISKNVGGVVAYDMNGKISDSYNTGVVYGAQDYVGGVAGYVEGDTITNCYNTGAIDGPSYGPSYDIGGVVGFVKNGGVTNSYNTGSVNGFSTVGGVVGELDESLASNVYNTAEVSGKEGDAVGGLAGYVDGVEISNGYNTGSVKGGRYVGGIAGGSSESVIKNIYNSATVTANESFGAVVGYCRSGKIGNAYYNTDLFNGGAVTDSESVAIVGDIAGKTAAQLIAGTSVTLDETVWAVGAKGENAKQDTLFYPYLKALGSYLYVMGDIKKYTIAVVANDNAMGSVTGASGEYEYGTEIEISATANEGYKFTDWQDDVKDAKRTITVTKNETYTANFEKIQSSSSSAKSKSSSSSAKAKSSSSSAKAKSSSSSAKAKSSSSSAKAKSSSSKGKDAFVATAQGPQFSVTVSGRVLSIVGARPNTNMVVFDMQGNCVKTEVVTSANFSFALPSAGTYIVKNGYTAKRVNVR